MSVLCSSGMRVMILTLIREESVAKDIPVCGIVRVDDITTKQAHATRNKKSLSVTEDTRS